MLIIGTSYGYGFTVYHQSRFSNLTQREALDELCAVKKLRPDELDEVLLVYNDSVISTFKPERANG